MYSKDTMNYWQPPGKNCGLCGEINCESFLYAVGNFTKSYEECPFYHKHHSRPQNTAETAAIYPEKDVLGHSYDFVLEPLPGEVSARKIVLPFRADMVEKMKIKEGDYVLGRPMGAGCPIPHVLQVIRAELVTGLLYTWVVGPRYSREHEVKDVVAYHMIGFEGLAAKIKKEPSFGCRVTFLPGFCMMSLNHTGLVNMLLQKSEGLHLRIEDIHLLAGCD
ncbi:MAG: (Fe-S)-binding protein [Dethiobacteria bacterium]